LLKNQESQFPSQGEPMRRRLAILLFISLITVGASAQSSTASQSAPAAKPAPPKPIATIDTTAGKMTCTLFPDKAPIGVANFVGLSNGTKDWKSPTTGATKHGVPLYDGTIFHRVIPEFMIQGGDPAGTGSGADPVKTFANEVSPDLTFDQPGRLAYANAGPNTNTSQFFITEVAFTGQQGTMLNGHYTIFGQCDEASVELVKQIARMSRDPSNDKPFRPVKIVHITITGIAKPHTAGTPVKKPATTMAKPSASSN
jgi:peptidyl-prolyl cis-trans isomerase A (cyclophilin A)